MHGGGDGDGAESDEDVLDEEGQWSKGCGASASLNRSACG